jgi:hypothetical protein
LSDKPILWPLYVGILSIIGLYFYFFKIGCMSIDMIALSALPYIVMLIIQILNTISIHKLRKEIYDVRDKILY